MSATIDAMRTTLRNDAQLSAILPGGIYDRELDPNDAITGAAWVLHPETGVPHLAPCAVLIEPQEVDSTTGYRWEKSRAYDVWPDVYIYAELGDVSATFDAADARIMKLLHDTRVGTATIEATGFRAAPLRSDELPGDVRHIIRRFRVQAVRHF